MHNDTSTPSDADIVRQVVGGNVNAFEILLNRHQALVLRVVNRHLPNHEVEETIQDVFVRANRSLPTFNGTGDFSHWLASIAVRTCYDYWRKAYRAREIPLSELTDRHQQRLENVMSEQREELSAPKGYRSEAGEVLDWALARLPAEDRMVLALVYFEDLSVKEAAKLLSWSVANVKIRSFRARRKLEKTLKSMILNQGGGCNHEIS
ncbi:MAG: sigma-70 family RNA polymerase sigma factor [Desulfobacterales bacterium]|nr:sigma-70 family RNA polymerase sigma factor [Desulfobacterales bacterium]